MQKQFKIPNHYDHKEAIMKKIVCIIVGLGLMACSQGNGQDTKSSATDVKTQVKMVTKDSKMVPDLPQQKNEVTKKQSDDVVDKDLIGLSPMESIKYLDKQLEEYHLGKDLSDQKIKENESLKKKIIKGTFDIRELCRLALAKHWQEISATEQDHFVGLMTTLLEKKAIFSKEQLKGENKYYKINYQKETFDDKDKTRSVVRTKMIIPKEKMDLDITYKLVKSNDAWKIFDVMVDDASLLTNYRVQFDRIIKKNGFKDLVSRMEKKLASIK